MKYVLGLDVGIKSVGWSVIELDSQLETKRIVEYYIPQDEGEKVVWIKYF